MVTPEKTGEEFQNENGNTVYRFIFPPGTTTIEHDALVQVSSQVDNFGLTPRYESLAEVCHGGETEKQPIRKLIRQILTDSKRNLRW